MRVPAFTLLNHRTACRFDIADADADAALPLRWRSTAPASAAISLSSVAAVGRRGCGIPGGGSGTGEVGERNPAPGLSSCALNWSSNRRSRACAFFNAGADGTRAPTPTARSGAPPVDAEVPRFAGAERGASSPPSPTMDASATAAALCSLNCPRGGITCALGEEVVLLALARRGAWRFAGGGSGRCKRARQRAKEGE